MDDRPFQRLLLATEHTEFDVGAERVAFELARHCRLPLAAVLPILTNPEYEATAPEHALACEQAASAKGEALYAAARAADVDLELSVRRGDEPYLEIVDEARARHADLIVARRRGKQGFLAQLLVGEMIGNVVRFAPCSVVLVPRGCRMWETRILAAIDDTAAAATVVATAQRVAAGCGLPLLVASVAAHDTPAAVGGAEAAVAAALRTIRESGRDADGRVVYGPAAESIAALAHDSGADLVVAGRGGSHSAWKRHGFGATAKKIAGFAACPVLIVAA